MKRVKFITTFSKNGYEVYGKTWLDTFTKNVKDKNVSVDLYVDFPIVVSDNRINLIDFNSVIPNHKKWLKEFENSYKGSLYNKKMGMRFSYKSFVMQHALQINSDCYLIWLDGDCIFKPNQTFSNFQKNILNGKFISVQREQVGGNDHCESGFVLFDTTHSDKEKFLTQFIENYKIENIIKMSSPYDGFVIYKSLCGLEYFDLNDGYGRGGIQSVSSETFLHPELNKRFLHNIGPTGKLQYDAFESIALKDEYFRLIRGNQRSPIEIKKLKNTLIEKRNISRFGGN